MRLLPPTVFILVPAAIGAVGTGMVYAQSPRSTVLVLSEENPGEGPSLDAFVAALRRHGRTRPLLREGSGVYLGSEGRLMAGAGERGAAAVARGREYLRLLQYPEAESALDRALYNLAELPDAEFYEHLTFIDVLQRRLKVMDSTAISLCMDNKLPILVFSMKEPGNVERALRGERLGTLVE